MKPEDQDEALWRALGQAREPRVSPFFARNVVRAAREQDAQASFWINWRKWILPATAAAVLAIAGVNLTLLTPDRGPSGSSTAASVDVPSHSVADLSVDKLKTNPDYEVIAELDTLLAFEKNDTWLDSSASN